MISTLEFKGIWFLPTQKNNKISGQLTFDPFDGTTLELFGSFEKDDIYNPNSVNENIILGITDDSRSITLYKCFVTHFKGKTYRSQGDIGIPTVRYYSNYFFLDAHFENEVDIRFNSIKARIFNLEEWININGLTKSDITNSKFALNYDKPKDIDFTIDSETNGKLTFSHNLPYMFNMSGNLNIQQFVHFEVKLNKNKNFSETLSYLRKFQNFLILGLYQSTHPTSIILHHDDYKEEVFDDFTECSDIYLFYPISSRSKKPKIVNQYEMLFSYNKIKEQFPTIITNWFQSYSVLEPAYDLVLEHFFYSQRFTTNNFLNLAQAAETFHSRISSRSKVPKEEYSQMQQDILSTASAKHHEWLKNQFKFGNNLNLHDRLVEITERYSNKILDENFISDKLKFIKQIKHSRNYYTHYSSGLEKKALKEFELSHLSQKLKMLLISGFLLNIGFEKTDVETFFENAKWQLFNHLLEK